MNGWTVKEVGHYRDVLHWGPHPDPDCPPDGVVVEVAAAAINFPDLLMIAGKYQVRPPRPFVPGLEAVGIVVKVGADSRFSLGDRLIVNGTHGAFAEKMAATDRQSFPAPQGMSDAEAAGFVVAYQTSHFALTHRAGLSVGEVLLVHGGAGGVGTSAIQLGKYLGARVIATASTDEKLKHCKKVGADDVINYTETDFASRVKELTGGHGADVIFDPVGGDVTATSTKCIAWNGRLLIIGFAAGEIPSIPANRILLKNISVVGLHWGNYFIHQPLLVNQAHQQLTQWFDEQVIRPVIGGQFPLADLPAALEVVEQRRAIGKIILGG